MGKKSLKKYKAKHILGIACTGHGASIAYIGPDGVVRCSVLDRWIGKKNVLMFAKDELKDIKEKRSEIDTNINNVLTYSFGTFPVSLIFETVFPEWLNWLLKGLGVEASDIDLVITSESHFATGSERLAPHLKQWLPSAQFVGTVEHHTIHQCQAFWQSGFKEAAVLTLDTCGENLERCNGKKIAGTIATMNENGELKTIEEFLFPESSVGLIYAITNHHIGFRQGEEGKTMGLASFGNHDLFEDIVSHLTLYGNGSFSFLNSKDYGKKLHEYVPARKNSKKATILDKHKNAAFAGQCLIELIITNAFRSALETTGLSLLVYAGGVALNSVANDIAFKEVKPDGLYIAPNPGDTGQALGCALYGAYNLTDSHRTIIEMPDYLGVNYSLQEIETVVKSSPFFNAHYSLGSEKVIAKCIANGYVIARFAGAAEFGPRALGNRSILCDPRRQDTKKHLDTNVKHREEFRPYAPTVLFDYVAQWFELVERSPYMLRVVPTIKEKQKLIPAVVHVDGTARVQTLEYNDNPGYWQIIDAFHKITDVPILLNTSFNVAGKPIVETPDHAIECFKSTQIDILLIEEWILSKQPLNYYLDNIR